MEKFSFRPRAEDVGKKLAVDKVVVGIGRENGLKMKVHQKVPRDQPEADLFRMDFPAFQSKLMMFV